MRHQVETDVEILYVVWSRQSEMTVECDLSRQSNGYLAVDALVGADSEDCHFGEK